MYNHKYVSANGVETAIISPYMTPLEDNGKPYYTISTSSCWVYVFAPLIGCVFASIFHWKNTNMVRNMKDMKKAKAK